MMAQRRRPPRAATWLISLAVEPGPVREGLLGDLEERYQRLAEDRPRRAWAWYWREAAAASVRYGVEAARHRIQRTTGGMGMDGWMRDLRLGVRGVARRPGFAAAVVLTLALGIGANTAVFSVLHGVLLEPLPFESPEQLVMADQLETTGFRASVSVPNYEDWRDRSTVFEAFSMERPGSFRVDNEDGAEVLEGRSVLDDFFHLFGVSPVIGTLPTAQALGPGAERIVVLTHGFWTSRFGGREDVVGETLRVEGEPFRIVAVLPRGFALDNEVAFYLPLGLRASEATWTDRDTSSGGWVVARLRQGVTIDQARADLARVTDDLRSSLGERVSGAALFPMREWYVGEARMPLLFLVGGVVLVLLVACANVASLFLGRAEERRGELALRAALGARRGSIVRSLLADTLVLATLGGVVGLGLAAAALSVLGDTVFATLPPVFAERVGIDGAAVAVMAGMVGLVTLTAGLAPAFTGGSTTRARLGRSVTTGPEGTRMRGVLVAGEVALTVALLVCTGLLVRSVGNLQGVDPGFTADGVLVQRMSAPRDRYPDAASVEGVYETLRQNLVATPGVGAVALSNLYPFSRTNWEMEFRDPARWPAEDPPSVLYTASTPEYFDVFSIRLLQGRLFTDADRFDTEPVVVIDETAAAHAWPGEDPIGKRISVDNEPVDGEFVPLWRTVIGVVSHVRNYDLAEPSRIEAYVPLAQSRVCCRTVWLSVRSDGDPAALAPTVRRVVRDVDSEMPLYRVSTMSAVVAQETVIHRAVRSLFLVFGLLALALGGVGVYGVVASLTRRRRREIGLRVALGATPVDAVGRVAGSGMRWVGLGLIIGLAGSLAAGRAVQSFLVGVRPWDPSSLLLASGTLILAALIATIVPAWRALGVGPAEVLKEE